LLKIGKQFSNKHTIFCNTHHRLLDQMTWTKTVQNNLHSHRLSWTEAVNLTHNSPLWGQLVVLRARSGTSSRRQSTSLFQAAGGEGLAVRFPESKTPTDYLWCIVFCLK